MSLVFLIRMDALRVTRLPSLQPLTLNGNCDLVLKAMLNLAQEGGPSQSRTVSLARSFAQEYEVPLMLPPPPWRPHHPALVQR